MARRSVGRPGRLRQRLLPSFERRSRLERGFRRAIIGATLTGLGGIGLAVPNGRAALVEQVRFARLAAWRAIGLEPDRADVDAAWAERRALREVKTRAVYREVFAKMTRPQQALLAEAGVGPGEAVVRWGNYDRTFVLSSKVFAVDDAGRSYRFRPSTRSFFLRQIPVVGLDTCQFFVPDTPEVRGLAADAGLAIPPEGSQSINSWGCRGPEPDLNADFRGLVLGDSFMQGYLLNDDQTPPVRLERALQAELGLSTSILNTGTLGYSPEHYYHTLVAFAERFRPHGVIVALFANDFGEEVDVFGGRGDWPEGKYWLDKILWHCLRRNIPCVLAPVPSERQIVGPGHLGDYPGQISNITGVSAEFFCDPTPEFVTEDLRINLEAGRSSKLGGSLLYNGALGDNHLSPRGAELWGRIVARRVALILKARKRVGSKPGGASG